MNLNFSEEQQMLQDTFSDFMREECSSEFVRRMEEDDKGYSDQIWSKMGALGWMGLMLPEEYGGLDFGVMELIILMEETGRVCFPSPYLESTLAAIAIAENGKDTMKRDLLTQVVSGDIILSLAFLEPEVREYDPLMCTTLWKVYDSDDSGNEFIINGCKLFVTNAHVSDYIVVSACRSPGNKDNNPLLSLFVVPTNSAGVSITPLTTISGDKQFEVVLKDVKVDKNNLLGALDEGGRILEKIHQIGALAKSAELVGMGSAVLDMTAEYAKNRHQFGQPIAKFQAIQHHCANMLIDLESSRYLTYKAAWLLDARHEGHVAITGVKSWVGEAIQRISALGHQIGGATAYMSEHDMTLYSRRIKSADLAFGDASYHRRSTEQVMGL